jgi:hypothetical protein
MGASPKMDPSRDRTAGSSRAPESNSQTELFNFGDLSTRRAASAATEHLALNGYDQRETLVKPAISLYLRQG